MIVKFQKNRGIFTTPKKLIFTCARSIHFLNCKVNEKCIIVNKSLNPFEATSYSGGTTQRPGPESVNLYVRVLCTGTLILYFSMDCYELSLFISQINNLSIHCNFVHAYFVIM